MAQVVTTMDRTPKITSKSLGQTTPNVGSFPPFSPPLIPNDNEEEFLRIEIRPAQPPEIVESSTSSQDGQTELWNDTNNRVDQNAPSLVPSPQKESQPSTSIHLTASEELNYLDSLNCLSVLLHNPNDKVKRDLACSQLVKCSVESIEHFLTPICLLLVYQISPHSNALEQMILEFCRRSVHFALKVSFILGAFIKGEVDQTISDRADHLRYACQLAFVDGDDPHSQSLSDDDPGDLLSSTPLPHPEIVENEHRSSNKESSSPFKTMNSTNRQHQSNQEVSNSEPLIPRPRDIRYKYMWSIKRLVKELSAIGSRLQSTVEADRPAALRSELRQLNSKLHTSVTNPTDAVYSSGVYLPLLSCFDPHYAIIRFREHEATVLKSRDRVPYCICIETISLPQSLVDTPRIHTNSKVNLTHSGPTDPSLLDFLPSTSFYQCSHSHVESLITDYASVLSAHSDGIANSSNIISSVSSDLPNGNPHADSSSIGSSLVSTSTSPTQSHQFLRALQASHPTESIQPEPSSSAPTKSPSFLQSSTFDSDQLKYLLSVPRNANSIQLKEFWQTKEARIRAHSPFGDYPGWKLRSAIVKYGADCLQEHTSLFLVRHISKLFQSSNLELKLIPYSVLVVDGDACLIDPLIDAVSIHQLKKNNKNMSLKEYYIRKWGAPETGAFKKAQKNFAQSLAAYSLICFMLQLKDRHNGNIMIDDQGNIVHIDWGYLLWNSPGSIGFETAPFKLVNEYVEVLDGSDSPMFNYFKRLIIEGFLELRKHGDSIIDLIRIMFLAKSPSKMPCSQGGEAAIQALSERFCKHLSDADCHRHVQELIAQSLNNWRTANYDYYQYYTNGIFY